MSAINIQGLVKNIKERTTVYTPIIEAIVNSIDAIDDARKSDGEIKVLLKRNALPGFDADALPNIVDIEIHDNGTGFTDKNRNSFDTLYSDLKIKRGGKGFGSRQRETIRLRHLDCPERDTPEGRAAKKFVEAQLAACDFIHIKSVKTRKEKWGRYLGDVFLPLKPRKTASGAAFIYLNQLLLDKGHAVRLRA